MYARYSELLTPDQVRAVHEAALALLDEVGLLVRNEKARERFRRHGCRVDPDRQTVTFPRAVVEEFRSLVPPRFTFHARDEEFSKTIPDDALVVATASSAPNLLDPETGEERRSRSGDIARIGHLVSRLNGIDVFSVSVTADDAPPGQFSLSSGTMCGCCRGEPPEMTSRWQWPASMPRACARSCSSGAG